MSFAFPIPNKDERRDLWESAFVWMEQRPPNIGDFVPTLLQGQKAAFRELRAQSSHFAKTKMGDSRIRKTIKLATELAWNEKVDLKPAHIQAAIGFIGP
jgi:hypothetical protein